MALFYRVDAEEGDAGERLCYMIYVVVVFLVKAVLCRLMLL